MPMLWHGCFDLFEAALEVADLWLWNWKCVLVPCEGVRSSTTGPASSQTSGESERLVYYECRFPPPSWLFPICMLGINYDANRR